MYHPHPVRIMLTTFTSWHIPTPTANFTWAGHGPPNSIHSEFARHRVTLSRSSSLKNLAEGQTLS
eukprot:9476837-Pyramimonas_sp.AAC.1